MILSMQKPQLAIVTGQLTNKVGIYLFVVFFPLILSKKGLKTFSPLF